MAHRRPSLVFAGALWISTRLLAAGTDPAPVPDRLRLANGDRLSGEIQGLERGELTFKTDATGTVSVDWERVRSLESVHQFDVQLEDGSRRLGTLGTGEEGALIVVDGERHAAVPLSRVVQIRRIHSSFWARIDGSLGLGLNYTSADSNLQWNVSAEARTRKLTVERTLSGSWIETTRESAPRATRSELSWTQKYLLARRRVLLFAGELQKNDELGIDLRGLVLAAYGRSFVQTSRARFSGLAGLAHNVEDEAGGGSVSRSNEAVFGLDYELFRRVGLDRDITMQLLSFHGLGGKSRNRLEVSVRAQVELVRDFGLRLELLESYDSRPPSQAASSNDTAAVASLVWSY